MVTTSSVDDIGQPNARSPVHAPVCTGWWDLEHQCRLSPQISKHEVVILVITRIRSERVCCSLDGSGAEEKSEKRCRPKKKLKENSRHCPTS